MVGRLDLFEDVAVQLERRPDRGTAAPVEQGDPRLGDAVARAGDSYAVGQPALQLGWADARAPCPRQHVLVHPERRQFLGGQVDPAAVEVLADVSDEVRQLERLTECRRQRQCGVGVARPEDGDHLQTDDRRGPIHVDIELVERGVAGGEQRVAWQVHPHRGHERAEVVLGDVERDDRVGEGEDCGRRRPRGGVRRGCGGPPTPHADCRRVRSRPSSGPAPAVRRPTTRIRPRRATRR